ncbi:metallophosphoesterase [Streptomyces tsukubensis]|uniref:Serine/threonine protein phosphatase n=1 Tax=Streptomyces tsukubensis TaxID=83656 RepID=A0A1V4A8K1_9ACTN|nr:metallophosphoesterase [Streptomyces tsukubensis]OON79221.1 serine/threonine protein phosphatase [Streptomyces tsukubensis]QFR94660.1 serine/threonine protein phosphatase [Streptomyces tsukubensis]
MTQGAGQGPAEHTPTVRDFRVPAYVHRAEQNSEVAEPGADLAAAAPDAEGRFTDDEHSGERGPYPPDGPGPDDEPYAQAAARYAQESVGQESAGQGSASVAEPRPAPDKYPEGAASEGYTPTQRDLPVISRADAPQPQFDSVPPPNSGGPGPLYVVGDVHGYLAELIEALQAQGLIDAEAAWSAGNARLWFLGDFTDRGPDGIGVIDLVMRLSAEAAAAGGYCKALMGNHELLLLGAKRFGDTPVNSGAGTATFQAAWLLNGGQKTDMERLQDVHLQWMSRLDAIVEEDGHLLTHSDTTAYLDYGDSIEAVNDTVHEILTRNDADECWDVFRKLTKRFAFRDDRTGPGAVRELLDVYGGGRIVHGHSPIPYLLGEVGSEDGDEDEGPTVEGPHLYADGLALAMDGGVTMAGKLLVCRLPLES